MSETRQSAVVGGFVGFLYGMVTTVQTYFTTFPFFMAYMTRRVASNPTFASNLQSALNIINTAMYVSLLMITPMLAVLGYLVGILFVKFKGHLPGSSIIRKAVVFSLILFAISFIPTLRSLLDPRVTAAFGAGFFPLRAESYALTLAEYLLFGWLFGYLLQRRLKPKGT